MLSQLYIQNIAVIERTSIEFRAGLNILTGETGAGKSILIDAISAVLGFRASRELIRTGADRAIVTALFEQLHADTCQVLSQYGYEPEEDGTLLLSREITTEGKNICKIGGRPANVSILRDVAASLIDIHGQHNNQALMNPEKHVQFVDSYAGTEQLLADYQIHYANMQQIKRELDALQLDDAEKDYRVDLLTYQTEEIAAADLHPGEEEELTTQRKRIANAAKIVECITQADHALNGDDLSEGVVNGLEAARDAISTASAYFDDLAPMSQRLEEIYYELREYALDVGQYVDEMELDSTDIDQIESRLDLIYKLKHKYGQSIEEILAFYAQASAELDSIVHSGEQEKVLQTQLVQATAVAQKQAKELSDRRQVAAMRLTKAVQNELKFLDMPFVRLEVRNQIGELTAIGMDRLEFLISTNPGEPPKALSKIASGGELSRIMLSIKNVLADKDHMGTLIFDEIDAGVSGRAAQKIGQKLHQVSCGRQIICVTHLAQVACYADQHLLIEKSIRNARTFTDVRILNSLERKHEIARIIGGEYITDTVLKNAEEMLQITRIPC